MKLSQYFRLGCDPSHELCLNNGITSQHFKRRESKCVAVCVEIPTSQVSNAAPKNPVYDALTNIIILLVISVAVKSVGQFKRVILRVTNIAALPGRASGGERLTKILHLRVDFLTIKEQRV